MVNLDALCEIEATVPTGFEAVATEEVEEKFNSEVTTQRGRINTRVKIKEATKFLDLCSIDNLVVIVKRYEDFPFSSNKDEAIAQIRDIVPDIDWDLGLTVWEQFVDFPHEISRTPLPYTEDFPEDAANSQICDAEISQDIEKSNTESLQNGTKSNPSHIRTKKTMWLPKMPAFRASCYRSGVKHSFQSPEAGANFGGAIHDYFHWNVDLDNFDIECVLSIRDYEVTVGLGLTKQSLHRRNIVSFGVTTLRPTVAYCLARLCRIQPGDVVCDPMCGSGSIPIEAAINWSQSRHICGDMFEEAPVRTRENVAFVNKKRREKGKPEISVEALRWDATKLPLRDASVDVFVSDMPFGKRMGSRMGNWQLYPRVLEEMARVGKPDVTRACLLTMDKKCFIQSCQKVLSLWRRGPTIAVNIGGISAAVYMLHRTSQVYDGTQNVTKEDKNV